MYERQTYLRDTETPDVDGAVIIETDKSDGYRITEKRDDGWCKPFWMPVSELDSLPFEEVGTLSSDQFLAVCKECGVSE